MKRHPGKDRFAARSRNHDPAAFGDVVGVKRLTGQLPAGPVRHHRGEPVVGALELPVAEAADPVKVQYRHSVRPRRQLQLKRPVASDLHPAGQPVQVAVAFRHGRILPQAELPHRRQIRQSPCQRIVARTPGQQMP